MTAPNHLPSSFLLCFLFCLGSAMCNDRCLHRLCSACPVRHSSACDFTASDSNLTHAALGWCLGVSPFQALGDSIDGRGNPAPFCSPSQPGPGPMGCPASSGVRQQPGLSCVPRKHTGMGASPTAPLLCYRSPLPPQNLHWQVCPRPRSKCEYIDISS